MIIHNPNRPTQSMPTLFLIFLLITFAPFNQYGTKMPETKEKSFLWEISPPPQTQTNQKIKHYLLGSVHALNKDSYPLNQTIETAFAQCEILAVEIDLSESQIGHAMTLMIQKGMYTGDDSLKKNISPQTLSLASKKFKKWNMSIESFDKFKPWMVAINIIGMETTEMGLDPNYGIDKYFLNQAAGKKQIVELEGIDFQLNLLCSLSRDENDAFLQSCILEADQYEKEFNHILNAWKTGNVPLMEKLLTDHVKETPKLAELFNKMIDKRNILMTEKILSYLQSGKSHMIIVGAAHLIGKNGIIELLKQKGINSIQL